jgi:hypothetical protein
MCEAYQLFGFCHKIINTENSKQMSLLLVFFPVFLSIPKPNPIVCPIRLAKKEASANTIQNSAETNPNKNIALYTTFLKKFIHM